MIKELNILRIIFMLMIFLNHSAFLPDGGYLGVACFFVLGGYCSTLGYYDKITSDIFNYKRYALSKAVKFYPLHWLCAIACLVIAIISSQPVSTFPQIVANMLLVQSWIPDIGYYFSLNGISWYLADTIFFALILPFIIRLIVNKSLTRNILFVILILVGYITVCIMTPKPERHAILYINPVVRFADFLLGVYLARGFAAIRTKVKPDYGKMVLFYIVSAFCIAGLLIEKKIASEYVQFAWIFWPLISALIMSTSIAATYRPKDFKVVNVLSQAGSYCFTFFMIHQMTIQVCNSIAHKILFEQHFAVMIITLVICCVLTYLCQKGFVSPVSKAWDNRLSRMP